MDSYGYRKSHCRDKVVATSSSLHNWNSYICTEAALYWTSPRGTKPEMSINHVRYTNIHCYAFIKKHKKHNAKLTCRVQGRSKFGLPHVTTDCKNPCSMSQWRCSPVGLMNRLARVQGFAKSSSVMRSGSSFCLKTRSVRQCDVHVCWGHPWLFTKY